jgi:hypothetical protein
MTPKELEVYVNKVAPIQLKLSEYDRYIMVKSRFDPSEKFNRICFSKIYSFFILYFHPGCRKSVKILRLVYLIFII